MNSYNTNYDSFESRRIRNLNKLNYELSKKKLDTRKIRT